MLEAIFGGIRMINNNDSVEFEVSKNILRKMQELEKGNSNESN